MYASVEYNSSFLQMLLLDIGYTLFRAHMGKGSLHHVRYSFLGRTCRSPGEKNIIFWLVGGMC